MRRTLYTWVSVCLFSLLSINNATIGNAQSFPLDPIIIPPSETSPTTLQKNNGQSQYVTDADFGNLYKTIDPAPEDSRLQYFSYKPRTWPWRMGVFSGLNYAYCGTWENTFGPNKRDKTLYNGTGLNLTLNLDYNLSKPTKIFQVGIGACVGYQNYYTRSEYRDYLYGLAATAPQPATRDQVIIRQRASEDIFLTVGPALSITLYRSRRNITRRVTIEVGMRGGVFSTEAATISAFIPSRTPYPEGSLPSSVESGKLVQTVGPSSKLYHLGGILSAGIFFPVNDQWQLGLQAQGFRTGLRYVISSPDGQGYEYYRKHGGFSAGIAIHRIFPDRRLVPKKQGSNDVSKIYPSYIGNNKKGFRDPIIGSPSETSPSTLKKSNGRSQYMTHDEFVALYGDTTGAPEDSRLPYFLYKQSTWPWRLGIFSGVNLAYCGTWENTLGPNIRDNTQFNGAGFTISGNVDYLITPSNRKLRIGLGTAFGYQNYATRSIYSNYLYNLAALEGFDHNQVSISQGLSADTYLTIGPLVTYALNKNISAELSLRGGLFHTKAATISAFVPSQGTLPPGIVLSLREGGRVLRTISPGSQLYHPGGLVSLSIFHGFGKNWQLGVQTQFFYTSLNYLIITGNEKINNQGKQVIAYTRSYGSLNLGATLRMLLPQRKLVPKVL